MKFVKSISIPGFKISGILNRQYIHVRIMLTLVENVLCPQTQPYYRII